MSADTTLTLRDEMESLLPFYLNGTLQGPDLVRLENWLATDPQGAIALAEAEDELAAAMAANEAIRPRRDA
ncbi:MAG: anti-sigma factor, partial [Rhizobiaceae bacterium]